MATKYKLRSCGTGLKLYVVDREDGLNTGMVVSGCPLVNGKDKPWVLRWMDFYSVKHEDHYRTKAELLAALNGGK